MLLVFLTFGVSHTPSSEDGDVDKIDSSSRRSKSGMSRVAAAVEKPHHLAAVGRLVNFVTNHQSHVRKQNTSAKSANDVPEHEVVDLVKMIRATAAPAIAGSDDDGDEGNDESTSLLPATTAASRVGRQRHKYRPMSARNVLTLTRLARLMKGGGEGGIDGLASDKLPHVGEVLSAIDRMTSKRIDDNNRDQTTGSENISTNDDSREYATMKTGSNRKKKQTRKTRKKETRLSSLYRNQNRPVERASRRPQPEMHTASILSSGVDLVPTSQRKPEALRNPTSTSHATTSNIGVNRSATSSHEDDRRSMRRSAKSNVDAAALVKMGTGTHADPTSVVAGPLPYEQRASKHSGVPHASSEPPMRVARPHSFTAGTDTGHAGTSAAPSVNRHPGSPAVVDRSPAARGPDTGTGPMTLYR